MKKFLSKGQCIGEINIKFWIQIVAFTISTFCGNVTYFKESYISIKLTGSMELPPLNSHLIKRAMEIFWKVIYIYIYIYIYFKTPLSHNCAVHEALFLCFLFWFGQAAVSRNFRARSVPVITIIRDWLAII